MAAPSSPDRASDRAELLGLAVAYARAADERDAETFAPLFAPGATLRVRSPAGEVHTLRGADIASVPVRLGQRYHRTFHLLGQASHEVDGDRATGEVLCVAHHLALRDGGAAGGGAEDHVMYIRYADTYARDGGGRWRFADRLVQVQWTETRPANDPRGG